VDRVDGESNGGLHIIDYKTGTRPPQNDWTQLHLQALVLSRKLASPINRVSFLYLGPSVRDSAELSKDVLETAYLELLRTARDIRREKLYLPATGPWCSYCDFISICPGEALSIGRVQGEAQMGLWADPVEE
jgi:RecB family exonuclease